jgi:hypothetical protein
VNKTSRRLTVAIDADVLEAARAVARLRGTTVGHLVREHLTELAASRKRLARARLEAVFERGLVKLGKITWRREDLYER